MSLPPALVEPVTAVLRQIGDASPITGLTALAGGCIHHACRLETTAGRYLLKWNSDSLSPRSSGGEPWCRVAAGWGEGLSALTPSAPGVFSAEAHGLTLLAATRTVRVPEVLAFADPTDVTPGFLLAEYLDTTSPKGVNAQTPHPTLSPRRAEGEGFESLGEQLAGLHRAAHQFAGGYGLDQDNYIGATPQINGWLDDWVTFFIERRLRPQLEWAGYLPYSSPTDGQEVSRGALSPAGGLDFSSRPSTRSGGVKRSVARLLERLPERLGGIARRPALLHGDLWSGNIVPAGAGLALIDPAVYYGDREAELAFTQLFGGFPARFYAAYQAAWPLEPGFAGRAPLYNLYHLLNHLNLFGESYRPAVEAILRS